MDRALAYRKWKGRDWEEWGSDDQCRERARPCPARRWGRHCPNAEPLGLTHPADSLRGFLPVAASVDPG